MPLRGYRFDALRALLDALRAPLVGSALSPTTSQNTYQKTLVLTQTYIQYLTESNTYRTDKRTATKKPARCGARDREAGAALVSLVVCLSCLSGCSSLLSIYSG